MNRLSAVIAGVVLACVLWVALPVSAGLSPAGSVNQDGSWDSTYRRGDKPAESPGCVSGWTCLTDPACGFSSSGSGALSIVAIKASDVTTVPCLAYKEVMSAADIHVEASISSPTGNQGAFATAGIAIFEGFDPNDFRAYHTWFLGSGAAACKRVENGANLAGSQYAVVALPEYHAIQYVNGGTKLIRCMTGPNGSTWTQNGTDYTKTLTFPVYAVAHATSYSASASTAWNFTGLNVSDTLESSGPPAPEPEPPVSDTPDYPDPLDGITLLGGRTTTNVANSSALTTELGSQSCGETLNLAAGTYTGNRSITASCPTNNPFIIKCASSLGSCVATGTWTLTGARNIVTGMRFTTAVTGVSMQGTNNRVVGNQFTGWGPTAATLNSSGYAVDIRAGSYGEIAYNEMYVPKAWPAAACPHDLRFVNMVMRMNDTSAGESSFHKHIWIHHNFFRDLPEKPCANYQSGQSEPIETCQGYRPYIALLQSGWYIEWNLIKRYLGGDAVMDMKCPATVRYNTVTESTGSPRLSQRMGTAYGSIFESNYLNGTGGISATGSNNKIIGNILVGGGNITVNAGLYQCPGGTPNGENSADYTQTCNALIAANTGALRVGYIWRAPGVYPATGTVIWQHTGSITTSGSQYNNNSGTTTNNSGSAWSGNYTPAVPLQEGQVGPGALSSASSEYRAARGL